LISREEFTVDANTVHVLKVNKKAIPEIPEWQYKGRFTV